MPIFQNDPFETFSKSDYEQIRQAEKESILVSLFHAFAIPTAICVAGIAFFWSFPASSQTLTCSKAKTTAEFTVCNSEKLMILDERVDEIYAIALADQPTKPQKQAVSREHNNWQIKRASCGSNNACLAKVYTKHIESLAASATSQTNITAFKVEN
ncbi:MAG: hypothetical protein COC17_04570 [Hyphomicrobiales bacterium]|nr:hypothetical protein [Hyphomicrobiales bacterium]PCH50593.1 MAG: hypothetical protein COC17_04570 [Hyphomicrobiales bacterium]